MKANKKKIIVLVAMVLLLVATGVLNYFLNVNNKNPGDGGGDDVTLTFFEMVRQDRETMRAGEIAILDDIIAGASSTPEAIANAEAQKLGIVGKMEMEYQIETLIKAKGFGDTVVTIGLSNVNVVVDKAELSLAEAAQILDVIVSETEFPAAKVEILPYM